MAAAVEHGEERLVGDAVGAHPDVARQPPELAHEVDLEASDAGEARGASQPPGGLRQELGSVLSSMEA